MAFCVREVCIAPYRHQTCSCDLFWQIEQMTYTYRAEILRIILSSIISPFGPENGRPQNERAIEEYTYSGMYTF